MDDQYLDTLDNFVAVTPDQVTNKRSVTVYMDLADKISLPLAPLNDPEKAFTESFSALSLTPKPRNGAFLLTRYIAIEGFLQMLPSVNLSIGFQWNACWA